MFRLEFLSEDKVEVASRIGLAAEYFVEAVSPVNAKQTDHRQEDTDTHSKGALHVQWVKVFDVVPCITAFGKSQAIYVGAIA